MHLRFNPVHRERHQTNALVGIKALYRFHQAHVTFLNQIGFRQSIPRIAASNVHNESQMGEHQLTSRVDALVVIQSLRQLLLSLG